MTVQGPEEHGAGRAENAAALRHIAEFLWEQSPGHFHGAYSKRLVEGGVVSQTVDFRMSAYQPRAYVERHAHEDKEQIYYFLSGEGLLEVGEKRSVVGPHDFVFLPRNVPHALHNTGLTDLVFLVITAAVGSTCEH